MTNLKGPCGLLFFSSHRQSGILQSSIVFGAAPDKFTTDLRHAALATPLLLRKLLSRPNFAVLKLLMAKSPRTTRELYAVLGKSFTRKTLIITLRNLSMNLNVLQPTHIRTEHGYDLGYGINPKLKDVIKLVEKCEGMVRSASSSPKS